MVRVLSTDIGTTTRVRVSVEHDGLGTLPRHWFVKLPSLSWRARWITALPQLFQTELRFYIDVAPSMPVLLPHLVAVQSRNGRGKVLILADLTAAGSTPGAPGDALSPEQASLMIEEIARLHAHFWEQASLKRDLYWLAGPVQRLEDKLGAFLAEPLMRRGLKRAGNSIPTALHAPAIAYARQRRVAMRVRAEGPRTLIHHDLHPGNLFWQDGKPGLLDWQLVRVGEGISDVAYFLTTALTSDIRRVYEKHLLARYQQLLGERNIAVPDLETLWQRYRAYLLYPFEAMVVTLGVGGMMALESNLELIRRAATAVQDHDAFGTGW